MEAEFSRRSSPNADLVGKPGGAHDLSGPALIVERSVFIANLRLMQERCDAAGIKLRPHAKTHKCSAVARHQLDGGAVGVCCATAHEVHALSRAGIRDILLTSPIMEPRKIERLSALARDIDLAIVVDHPLQVEMWEEALADVDGTIDVLVDIDIGMGRTGARHDDAVRLAEQVSRSPKMKYAGVQAYSGLVQHIEQYELRRETYAAQMRELEQTLALLKKATLYPATISGGGTGTMAFDLENGIFTEVQFGSYAFMDVEYRAVHLLADAPNPFDPALFVRSRTISTNRAEWVTIDAGFKALSADGPEPMLRGGNGSRKYSFFGDEYGRVAGSAGDLPRLGQSVDIIVPHCDPTLNLHDFLHIVEGDTLVDIWPIEARGSL